jgi:hypothetical protein
MELVALVFIWALWDVAKSAAKNARSDYGKSRGKAVKKAGKAAGGELPHSRERSLRRWHAASYWGREALHGFPAARLGLHAGWLAHRTAHDQQQAIRDEARTTHVETRADRLRNAREQRERQQRAQEEIDAIIADDPAPGTQSERLSRAEDELARRREQKGQAGDPPLPPEEEAQPGELPLGLPPRPDQPDGQAAIVDAFNRQQQEDADAYDSEHDWPTGIPHRRNGDAGSPATNGGNAMPTGTASEVTHSAVVASAQQYAGAAEQDAATAESRRKELETMADQMQALDVDSASLSEVMELADLHRQQEATAKQIQEHAAALPRNLQQRHGQLDEAHREAPVRAAERAYYGEG